MQINIYAKYSTPTQVLTYFKEEVERSWQKHIVCNMSLIEERGFYFPGQTIGMAGPGITPPELARGERMQEGLCK